MFISKSVLTVVTLVGATVAWAAPKTFEVYTVDDLTNACAQCGGNSGAEIRIHPGVYRVGDIAMDALSHLTVDSSGVGIRYVYGLGDGPGDVVIVGRGMDSDSGLRVINGGSNKCVISNLTVTGGCSMTNTGGGIDTAKEIRNCVISNNYAKVAGGGTDKLTAYDCLYVGNAAGTGNGGGGRFSGFASYNCTFSNNACRIITSKGLGGGVSLGRHENARFYANTASGGGGAHSATIVGGEFVGNRTWGTGGGSAVAIGTVSDCSFVDNISTNDAAGSHSGEVAYTATFEDCTFDNHCGKDDMFKGCTFQRCTIRGLKEGGIHRDVLNTCTFYNSLLVDIEHTNTIGSTGDFATGSKFYNCTVVGWTNLSSAASNRPLMKTYDNGRGTVVTHECVNTLFAQLKPAGISSAYALNFTNCLWTAQAGEGLPSGAVGGGLVTEARLHFADAAGGDYTLQRKSVARNAGWSDAAYLAALGPVDLAGKARVNPEDGNPAQIDIGAYECHVRQMGLMLLYR